jgi:predicted MFS family arabinose efflux permease
MPAIFKRSLPLILPYFINACGTIGLSLLPMILVAENLSVKNSTIIMSVVKTCVFLGSFLGGWFADRLGLRASLIISFGLSGLGLGFLSNAHDFILILICGCFAQLGTSMYAGQGRLLITDLLPVSDQQEAIGWLRTANNLGQIVSYAIGFFASAFGFAALLLFDALTSIIAMAVSVTKVPRSKEIHAARAAQAIDNASAKNRSWSLFVMTSLVIAGFSFLYEIYITSTSARCQIFFGPQGLKIFSKIMVINCVLCTVMAVVAARRIRDPRFAFPVGIFLVGVGSYITILAGASERFLFVGAFVVTSGEIFFTALASFVMIHVTPYSKNRGSMFGISLVIQNVGRILGGAAAFPMVIHGSKPELFIAVSAVAILLLTVYVSIKLDPKLL